MSMRFPYDQAPDDGRTWPDVDAIKAANNRIDHHWFSPAAMRGFRSKTYGTVHYGRYFISSEQMEAGAPRRYKIRVADHLGRVNTVNDVTNREEPWTDIDFNSYTHACKWLAGRIADGSLPSWQGYGV